MSEARYARRLDGVHLLLVEHGGPRKRFLFEALACEGLHLHLATSRFEPWLLDFIPRARILETDTHNSVRLLADVVAYLETNRLEFSGVGTFWEHTTTQTADVATALGLPSSPPGAVRRSSSNKLLMRRVAERNGIRIAPAKILIGLEKLEESIPVLDAAAVVKPVFGDDSYGVLKIEPGTDAASVVKACRRTWCEDRYAFRNFTDVWLLEEYIPGKLVSVDGVVQSGRVLIAGVLEIEMGPEPWFIQYANRLPPRLDDSSEMACCELAKAMIAAMGLDNSAFHIELRVGPKGPTLIEVAARLSGGIIPAAYLRAYGVDLCHSVVDLWLGRPVELERKKRCYVMQRGVFPDAPGRLEQLDLSAAQALKGVWNLEAITEPGSPLVTYPDTPVPIYVYAVEGSSHEEVTAISAEVERLVKVRTQ